jgi:hypothetical protein
MKTINSRYDRNSLRPNPDTADPAKGRLAFAVPPALVGDFGGDATTPGNTTIGDFGGGASPRITNGLPRGTDKAGKRRK